VLTLVKVKLPPPTVAARVNITFLQHALFLRPCLGADLPSARPFNNKCLPTLFVTDNVVVVVVVVGGGEIKLTLWKHLKGHAAEIRVSATGETHKRFYNYHYYYYNNNNDCNDIIFYNNRACASIGHYPYNIKCYDFTYEYEHHASYDFV